MTISAVILAAGRGDRMQTERNKILLPVLGQALICHAVSAFVQVPELVELILVTHSDEVETVRQWVHPIAPDCVFVVGGATRRDSSLAGVRAATGDFVLIHDGARPFPSPSLIRSVVAATQRWSAVVPVVPSTDLLYRVSAAGCIKQASDLKEEPLVRAQTPQGFRRDLILHCLEAAPQQIRDDATAVLLAGESVLTVPGDPANIKITHTADLALAEAIAASR